ncbi:hypothetical protein Tco_0781783 [Tanacetum coccineum]
MYRHMTKMFLGLVMEAQDLLKDKVITYRNLREQEDRKEKSKARPLKTYRRGRLFKGKSTTTLKPPFVNIDPKDKGKRYWVEENLRNLESEKEWDQGVAQIESEAELAQRLHDVELINSKQKALKKRTQGAYSEEESSKKQKLEEDNDARKDELRIVGEMMRYVITSPEGYDLLLWGDLKTLFEPNEKDEIWKKSTDYN